MEKYIQSQGYKIGTLVAFSGEVNDKESGSDAFSESSQAMNPNLRGREMREAFATDEYQILVVANMDALAAHGTMSKQALDSERVRDGLKDVLLGPAQLYESLRGRGDEVVKT